MNDNELKKEPALPKCVIKIMRYPLKLMPFEERKHQMVYSTHWKCKQQFSQGISIRAIIIWLPCFPVTLSVYCPRLMIQFTFSSVMFLTIEGTSESEHYTPEMKDISAFLKVYLFVEIDPDQLI